jgi:hypothetical protein
LPDSPSPYELWVESGEDPQRYGALLRQHGHIVQAARQREACARTPGCELGDGHLAGCRGDWPPGEWMHLVTGIYGDSMATDKLILPGTSNYGKPRQDFADELAGADDKEFLRIAADRIWLSAYAANNPGSDYHWQADACYDEAKRRGNPELYQRAWEKAAGKA